MDTIFALASARGKAGVSVIRLSGPQARLCLLPLVQNFPAPRQAALRDLRHDGALIDQALVLWFEEGRSFTGEETVELQVHGSPAIVRRLMEILAQFQGVRLADAGEFTRRALMNGKMDLAQVEGLADLIEAETEAQRRQAMRVFSGALGERSDAWRKGLVRGLALLAATIDFADEEMPQGLRDDMANTVQAVLDDLKRESAGFQMSERIRDGFEVAILGRPNMGKSTLLNRIAGRDAALISAHAGTTRDIIEVRMDLGGVPVTFLDTAGLRDAQDPVEAMGVARALERAVAADLRVFLVEDRAEEFPVQRQPQDLVLLAKADLLDQAEQSISGLTGQGVSFVLAQIQQYFLDKSAHASILTRARQRTAVDRAIDALEIVVQNAPDMSFGEEFLSEHLHEAVRALDVLLGRVDVEDVLGEIFASFCVGK